MDASKNKSGTESCGAGLARNELEPGTFVTVSESKRTCDRSLVDAIWVVIAVNAAHVLLKFHCGNPPHDPTFATRVVPLGEHDFYRADHLVAALESDSILTQSATVVRLRDCSRNSD